MISCLKQKLRKHVRAHPHPLDVLAEVILIFCRVNLKLYFSTLYAASASALISISPRLEKVKVDLKKAENVFNQHHCDLFILSELFFKVEFQFYGIFQYCQTGKRKLSQQTVGYCFVAI